VFVVALTVFVLGQAGIPMCLRVRPEGSAAL